MRESERGRARWREVESEGGEREVKLKGVFGVVLGIFYKLH